MSKWLILGLLAVLTAPSYAAKRVTVAQLEQTLTSAARASKTDIEIGEEIGRIELSERISAHTLAKLNSIAKGPRTAAALQLLADLSSFLPLPTNELPKIPFPDEPAQQRQLDASRQYAFRILPRLPNLLSTRTTYSFDDSPQEQEKGAWPERDGLHFVGKSKVEVSVLSEREHLPDRESASSSAQDGLATWGEFGSVLLMILNDSVKGTTTWSHWEHTTSGPVSVFNYSVPKSASHYEIATPMVEEIQRGGGSSRWWASGGDSTNVSKSKVLRTRPAYHGSLAIDPASGAILRASLVADLKGNQALVRGAILVEYGPVHIGDQTFMAPLRSLALSTAPGSVSTTLSGAATEWLNENLFTNYHLFASTSRVLTEQANATGQESRTKAADSNAATLVVPPPVVAPPSQPPDQTLAVKAPPIDTQAPLSLPRAEDLPHEPAVPNADVLVAPNPASGVPIQPGPDGGATRPLLQPTGGTSTSNGEPAATFHLDVNSVLVPVVVRDRHGNFVNNLQKQDFEVLDNGKPRPLSGFLIEKHKIAATALNSPGKDSTASATERPQLSLPSRITVFVFDDLDMGFEEIAQTQTAAITALDDALSGSDMTAIVSTSGKVNSGITRDRARLVDALHALRPVDLYHPGSTDCPKISYYQADLIVNKHDEDALQDVINQIMSVCAPKTPLEMARGMADAAAKRASTLGQQGVRATYGAISEYVRRMANLPGEHVMILVSSELLPIEEEARYEESKLMNLAADSRVTIDALDSRGLYTTSLAANQDLRGRVLGQVAEYREREMRTGEEAMGELAYATGGNFFHNNNDLESGFKALLSPPETLYLLELAANGAKTKGDYHRLEVKVDRPEVQVQARKGYFTPTDDGTRLRK